MKFFCGKYTNFTKKLQSKLDLFVDVDNFMCNLYALIRICNLIRIVQNMFHYNLAGFEVCLLWILVKINSLKEITKEMSKSDKRRIISVPFDSENNINNLTSFVFNEV